MSLPDFVELVRGQTACDYRPNTKLVPSVLSALCRSFKHRDLLLRIAHEGVRVSLREPLQQTPVPDNHNSVRARLNVLRKNVRKEQDAGRCLVLDLDLISLLPGVRISPYGVVDKAGFDPSFNDRTIHDLSFPHGGSINEFTDQSSIIHPDYKHCHAIIMEVLRLRRQFPDRKVYILAGDVAAAFRHIGIQSQSVHLLGAKIDEDNALVLDLACPFGWTGYPGSYDIFGGAIAHVHGSTIPSADAISPEPFFSYHWVDGHVNVAVHAPTTLTEAERSLRCAMLQVFGADAINEEKFSGWHTTIKVLGIIFNTEELAVSMPSAKIEMAMNKVCEAYHASHLSRHDYRSLLGCLRYVATCIRSARLFLQLLRHKESQLHRVTSVCVSSSMPK